VLPNHPLSDIRSNIEWAKSGIGDAERLIARFVDSDPWMIVGKDDPELGRKVYKLVLKETLDRSLQPRITSIVHTLRSSLDHLACALAARAGHNDVSDVYFPITKTKAIFEGPNAQGKIKKLPAAAQKCIARLKPYGGGNKLLRLLHELDVSGKHIRIIPIGLAKPGTMSVEFYPGFDWSGAQRWPADDIQNKWLRWESLEEGVVLFTARLGSDLKPDFEVATSVAFRDVEGLKREPVVTVLNQLVDLVERIVNIFERRFF
jgi:hypothetical protein